VTPDRGEAAAAAAASAEIRLRPTPARYRRAKQGALALTFAMLVFAALIAVWVIGLEGPIH
jgi:hypothetical protein